ncbi:MAG: cysteine desulfurase [Candidatus Micrarchaeota archaeon]|nr:cysteine desulfurase [Candidatus Micrarchaeota archaeon]
MNMAEIDVERIRKDFPILKVQMNGKELAYLDSAATSQKPRQVISKIGKFYKTYNANIHRGLYKISEEATEEYIKSKDVCAKFIHAGKSNQIIYVKNTTEAINLVALSWGDANIGEGDRILISKMEHHSNIVPWQMLAKRKKAVLDYIEITEGMQLDILDYKKKLERKPKLVALTHASNVLGTINDAKNLTRLAHEAEALVLIDGAQSTPHIPINLREIDCDFFAFSSHKMLGPSGIGVLYAKEEMLEAMNPLFGGGDMIRSVDLQESTWNDLPWKFEAGTQNIEGAIGFGAAVKYLKKLGMESVHSHEKKLTKYALKRVGEMGYVKVYGPGIEHIDQRLGVISFAIKGVHPHDAAAVFDSEGIAIRSGHHCAMPLMRGVLGEPALCRMSFYIYNKEEEIDRAIVAIEKARKMFSRG